MKNSSHLINATFFICLTILFFSCKKEIEYQWPKGNISGSVVLSSTNTNDYSGVLVTIDGASMQTITNAKGEYSFEGVPTGIYDIVYSKDGYGTYKKVSLQFIGGSEPLLLGKTDLYKLPVTTITNVSVSPGITITGNATGDGCDFFRYYISDKSDVSYKNYLYTGVGWVWGAQEFSFEIYNWNLPESLKGKHLFIILYPTFRGESRYTDINTGITIFSAINTSCGSNIAYFSN